MMSGGAPQFPAVPSPPAVMYNNSQQVQTQSGIYTSFQYESPQILNQVAAARPSQYSQQPYSTAQFVGQTQNPGPVNPGGFNTSVILPIPSGTAPTQELYRMHHGVSN